MQSTSQWGDRAAQGATNEGKTNVGFIYERTSHVEDIMKTYRWISLFKQHTLG